MPAGHECRDEQRHRRPRPPGAESVTTRSRLGVRIDRHPRARPSASIIVVNQEVFSRRDWYFQLFNFFHRTTRDYIIERELLINPGRSLRPRAGRGEHAQPAVAVARVIRRLDDLFPPELSSVVVILPSCPRARQVDLLVVTRDVWSLRFNTNFEFQGRRADAAADVAVGEQPLRLAEVLVVGFISIRAPTTTAAVLRSQHRRDAPAALGVGDVYNSRETGDYEGNARSSPSATRSISLATPLGRAAWTSSTRTRLARDFRGNSLRLVDLTATPAMEAMPLEYRRQVTTVDANVDAVVRRAVIQRVTRRLPRRPPLEVPPRLSRPAQAPQFLASTRRSRRRNPSRTCATRCSRRATRCFRDLEHFELRENRRLGPTLRLRVGQGLPELGADFRALSLARQASYATGRRAATCPLPRARRRAGCKTTGAGFDQRGNRDRVRGEPDRRPAAPDRRRGPDRFAARQTRANTPLRAGRRHRLARLRDQTSSSGQHRRARPRRAAHDGAARSGPSGSAALLFYDVGDAAPSFDQLDLHNDVGLGVRWLIPQLNSTVIRLRLGDAPSGRPRHARGLGRFSASFRAGVLTPARDVCFRTCQHRRCADALAGHPRRRPTR